VQLGVISQASSAALIAAGLLSVIISPATGLTLLRRAVPGHDGAPAPAPMPTPAMPVMTVADRALCHPGRREGSAAS
jgi:hypothetical protein